MTLPTAPAVRTSDWPGGPRAVDRIVVHQVDPARPSPGGIDTCLRGIFRYAPPELELAIVGVDTGAGPAARRLGAWERHQFGERSVWFLPVAKLDPANQSRRIPHSISLVAGLLRYRSRLPARQMVEAHRMDVAFALRFLLRVPQGYFIHTQENGLTGGTSDSLWRLFSRLHRRLETSVVRNARTVTVFNEDYAATVRRWNPRTRFSPTWFDPALVVAGRSDRDPDKIVWVGRLEVPKDPALALDVFEQLATEHPDRNWSLEVLGSGTRLHGLRDRVARMPAALRSRVQVRGRVDPAEVATTLARSGIFLMTSHPGYEGYPCVLVEAMAAGLVPVVTRGSDTGALVRDGETGYVTGRDPAEIADRIASAGGISRSAVLDTVSFLGAPTVVGQIYAGCSRNE
ncbi:glycosyltransferase [Mycetocola sp. 2940]|uniref:glycosyltransferase n=1 Tax=Mycetocola sp. 2940 TaxID=3156452 RepID=UPI003394E758